MSSWDVVLWENEKTVDFVPSSWRVNHQKNVYLWPKLPLNKLRRLINDCKPPDTSLSYSECAAQCKATVDNITLAETLVAKLQYESDLSSDNDVRLSRESPLLDSSPNDVATTSAVDPEKLDIPSSNSPGKNC